MTSKQTQGRTTCSRNSASRLWPHAECVTRQIFQKHSQVAGTPRTAALSVQHKHPAHEKCMHAQTWYSNIPVETGSRCVNLFLIKKLNTSIAVRLTFHTLKRLLRQTWCKKHASHHRNFMFEIRLGSNAHHHIRILGGADSTRARVLAKICR